MENNKLQQEDANARQTERLVYAIDAGNNVDANDILSNILAAKVEARYDEVIKRNG